MDFVHKPVLLEETLTYWASQPQGTYIDGTVGGGGHSAALLQRLPQAQLICIDQDDEALAAAKEKLAPFSGRVHFVKENFANILEVAKALDLPNVDGVLLDIGVSSYQLDCGERGFSYMQDAPLDMRMDRNGSGPTAAHLVNTLTEEELANIIYQYGEERFSRRIARQIVAARQEKPIATTGELTALIKKAMPAVAKHEEQHPAKRTFQALRIAVNQELAVLEKGLSGALEILRPGGHLCVITFHSLEDRIVKETFRAWAKGCTCPPDLPVCQCGKTPSVRLLTRKPIAATEKELQENPRSRSAKLRAVEKVAGLKF